MATLQTRRTACSLDCFDACGIVAEVADGRIVRIGGDPSHPITRGALCNTEVRAAASAFCYHQGAIFGGLVAPVLTYFAINYNLGFGIPMLVGTVVGALSFVIALSFGPETKGKELVPDLVVA